MKVWLFLSAKIHSSVHYLTCFVADSVAEPFCSKKNTLFLLTLSPVHNWTHTHRSVSQKSPFDLNTRFWTLSGNWSTWRKPTRHSNSGSHQCTMSPSTNLPWLKKTPHNQKEILGQSFKQFTLHHCIICRCFSLMEWWRGGLLPPGSDWGSFYVKSARSLQYMSVWVFSKYSGFLPQSKNMQVSVD